MMRIKIAMTAVLLGAGLIANVQAQTPGAANGRGEMVLQKLEERFMQMDKNGDGAVSKQEFMDQAEQRFKRLDRNGDGKITKDELDAAMEKLGQRGAGGAGGVGTQQFP